mgnify:CR=1 FL=1
MFLLNRIGMAIKSGRATDRPDAVFRLLHRSGDIHDRGWHPAAQLPWLMDINRRHLAQLRAPMANEPALWIVVCDMALTHARKTKSIEGFG